MPYTLDFKNKNELNVLFDSLKNIKDNKTINIIKKRIEKRINRKKIKSSSAKNKGRNLQYYICEKISEIFNIKFDQNNDQCDIRSREGGQHGTDIILRGEVYKKFPFDIECKNNESPSVKSWISQAKKNNKNKNRHWLLFWKCKKFKRPVVIMDSDIFFNFFKD